MKPNRTVRPGFTLAEVLIAIFIMGIGLISLLTLFPYAALQVVEAEKDDRAAYSANNADALARQYWRYIWRDNTGALRTWSDVKMAFPELALLDDPNVGSLPPAPGLPAADGDLRQQSYPLLIDPLGFLPYLDPVQQQWLGGGTVDRRIRRVGPIQQMSPPLPSPPMGALTPLFSTVPEILRDFTLRDNLDFDEGGVLRNPPTAEARYSWAWMIQRQEGRDPSEVDFSVLVFEGKNIDAPTDERVYTGPNALRMNPDLRTLQITANPPPNIKKGHFIMDGSFDSRAISSPTRNQRADFRRVIGIEEDPALPDTYIVEVERPFRAPLPPPDSQRIYTLGGLASDTENTLIEVFRRLPLKP